MGGDVAARAVAGIAAQRMPRLQRPAAETRGAAFHAVQQIAVAHQQAHQTDQVAAVPVPVHEGFRRTHAAIARQRAIETGVVHVQADRGAMSGLADDGGAERIGQRDFAAVQRIELAQ